MKQTILFLVAILSFNFANAQTEKSTTEWKAGFIFAPQGGIKLKNPESGFKQYNPLFFAVLATKGKITVNPFYALGGNNVGLVLEYSWNPNLGTYLVANKNIHRNEGYAGIGTDTPIAGGRALAFVEIGSEFQSFDPEFFFGIFIPLFHSFK